MINGFLATPGKPYAMTQNSTVSVVATANSGFEFSQWSGDLTSDESTTSIVMSCDKIITAHYIQAEPIETTPIYFPHIDCADGWETRLCLINRNATSLSGIFYAYNDQGELLDSSSRLTLAANGRIQIRVSYSFAKADEIGYIIFAAETDTAAGIVGYEKFYTDGKYRVAVPLVTRINQGDIFISHITTDDNWWTGVSLLNTTENEKELTFVFDNDETRSITLAPKEHRSIDMATLLQQRAAVGTPAHSAVIRGAAGIVGLELFSQGDQLSGILIKDQTATEIYYPHVAVDDGWWTGVVAYNTAGESGKLTFTAYGADGTALGEETDVSLAGHSQYIGSVADLSFPAGTAWFKVKSDQPIVAFELFGTANGAQLAGYSVAAISGVEGILPKLESDGYTGIAMVNVTNITAAVTLTAYKNDGTVVATELISLAGYAKIVDESQNLFSRDISLATYITYKSNQELVAFQINGASDNMMLDALPALR